jgi:hypothetical protein
MVTASPGLKLRLKEFSVLRDGDRAVLYDRATLSLRPLSPGQADTLAQIIGAAEQLPEHSPVWASIEELVEHYSRPFDINPLAGAAPPRGT